MKWVDEVGNLAVWQGFEPYCLPASHGPQQSPPVLRILPEFWRHFGDGVDEKSASATLASSAPFD
jgi:hypothetical protein